MARKSGGGRRNSDGSVTKPTGQASPARSSGSGRGFIPQGQKSASGPAITRTGGDLKPGPRTASNKVEGK